MNNENHTERPVFFTKLLNELALHMNFTIDFVAMDDIYGFWNESEHKWTGILGKLQSGEIDMAVTQMTMTKERVDAFDFTCPLILSRVYLFIKEPGNSDVQWDAYLKVYNYSNSGIVIKY